MARVFLLFIVIGGEGWFLFFNIYVNININKSICKERKPKYRHKKGVPVNRKTFVN